MGKNGMFGVLAVDKPAGMTSRDVVNRVARPLKPIKVGHTGTLDPLATGVLLLAIGPATRLTEYAHGAQKSYRGTFALGKRSDTLDVEGEITELVDAKDPTRQDLADVLAQFRGNIQQVPPRYSAIHVQGRRAYELAREGKGFSLPPREVVIHSLELVAHDGPEFTLDITCSSGTYVRTLGSDIAQAVGSDAIMTKLVRTGIGPVRLDRCVPLEDLVSHAEIEKHLLSPKCLIADLAEVCLSADQVERIRNGIRVPMGDVAQAKWPEESEPLAAVSEAGDLVAILERSGDLLRSRRVFPSIQ